MCLCARFVAKQPQNLCTGLSKFLKLKHQVSVHRFLKKSMRRNIAHVAFNVKNLRYNGWFVQALQNSTDAIQIMSMHAFYHFVNIKFMYHIEQNFGGKKFW